MKLYSTLPPNLATWAQRQPIFFTGSAPTHAPHINVSPKGMTDTHFSFLSPTRCAYIDRTGSGCETISHAYENGRLCLLFVSFGVTPRILRLFCRASVVEWDRPAFGDLVRVIAGGKRTAFDGARAVIVCDIWQAQTSCGFAVPRVKKALYDKEAPDEDSSLDSLPGTTTSEKADELTVFEPRPTLDHFSAIKVRENGMLHYQSQNNACSIDGLPGLRTARRDAGHNLWLGDAAARLRRVEREPLAVAAGFVLAVLLYLAAWGLRMLVF
ncbi:pyridoxamine phosphate oxidase family protein [Ophiocordyceps camponoti-floridani]|uniref:Pyridoxamine phosphate oxidase family protein n=1 Tax=Ophiocordyceps camponoti-floridani TaxID=2030778 RepID=A0A8H4QCE0_9HYPO|nr:pyridoxamine phosphate oxidase family protein [Ophiocordyceps camponoti-floridani]